MRRSVLVIVAVAVWTPADGRNWHRVKPENGGEVENPPGYPDWGAWIERRPSPTPPSARWVGR